MLRNPDVGNPQAQVRRRGLVRRLRGLAGRAKRRILGVRPVPPIDRSELYEAWVQSRPVIGSTEPPATPRLSVLMAVHDPPPRFLTEAIDSVRRQTHPAWELVISDDGSKDPAVLAVLDRLPEDARIVVTRSPQATGIVGALNRALERASGEFVGVLDHDDLLHPRAVELMLAHLDAHPDSDLAYSDEDKVDPDGQHFDPYFKPDYSPELLLASMYLNHFTAMRTALVREVGGLRGGTDGAQDHDLAFRMIRAGARVTHLPGVLYHWRAWPGSTATGIQAKPWAQAAAARVQSDHLAAVGFPGDVAPSNIPGLNEVHPGVIGDPLVSIVIPTISRPSRPGGIPLVNDCIASVRARGGHTNVEIIVVHTNEPSPVQRKALEDLGADVVTHRTSSFNFSEAINLGARRARGEFLLLLNDDTTVRRAGSVRHLLEYAQLPGVGAVGARLSYPDGRTQHAGMLMVGGLPTHPHHGAAPHDGGYFGWVISPHNCLAVTGAALTTRRETFLALGGLDESWPHDYQDVDYCLRLTQTGQRVAYVPYAHFTHVEGASLQREMADPVATVAFRSRWAGRFATDPHYSVLMDSRLSHLFRPL